MWFPPGFVIVKKVEYSLKNLVYIDEGLQNTSYGKGTAMEDKQIIGLYFERDEAAISETAAKYGKFCHSIALNILAINADAEECVNDTYLQAWNSIPPQRPNIFRAWLGRIVRNIAINLWNKNHRQKRYAGIEQLFDELEDCIPSPVTLERKLEEEELTTFLNTWLASLSQEDRVLFMRRYWNGEAVKVLASAYSTTPGSMAKRMHKLRQQLRLKLEKEGYWL